MILRDEKRHKPDPGPVSVRAVLTRRQHSLIVSGLSTLELPYGVSMSNKTGSTVLKFECEDRDVAEELCDGLDNSGISWDEML